ncbi:ATP-binding cassette domain-containing protein, partial [Escherichia coli]
MNKQPLLSVRNLCVDYITESGDVRAVNSVSFDIAPGEVFGLAGESGCGKSTLLKAVAGFIKPCEGEIRLLGQKVEQPGPDRIVVFQEFDQLPPWKTVKQNV